MANPPGQGNPGLVPPQEQQPQQQGPPQHQMPQPPQGLQQGPYQGSYPQPPVVNGMKFLIAPSATFNYSGANAFFQVTDHKL